MIAVKTREVKGRLTASYQSCHAEGENSCCTYWNEFIPKM